MTLTALGDPRRGHIRFLLFFRKHVYILEPMNNKTAIGLVVAIIVVGIALFALQKHVPATVQIPIGTTTAPTSLATTSSPSTGMAGSLALPPVANGKPVVQQTGQTKTAAPRITAIDEASLTTSSAHPVITGTANISAVAYVLNDPNGVGIAGSDDIEVKNGHWSIAIPQALKPGRYSINLIGGDSILVEDLIVK